MKSIIINGIDDKAIFTIHAYKAGESVTVFKGSTGTFGKSAGSKTAGIVYVIANGGGISAEDNDVDNAALWDWIQEWMQKGMDAQANPLIAAAPDLLAVAESLNKAVRLVDDDIIRVRESDREKLLAWLTEAHKAIAAVRGAKWGAKGVPLT